MGFSINIEDVPGEEIEKGVIRRVLLKPENTGKGPSGELTVTHYILSEGGKLTLDKPGVEYQDFIIRTKYPHVKFFLVPTRFFWIRIPSHVV